MLPKKILVIDDEEDILTYLSTFLTDSGFTVVQAANGKEGLQKAIDEKPDLITLDISMPEESGVKALRKFQQHETTKNTPVIIITGVSSELRKFIEKGRQVHEPEGYCEKPINREELLEQINSLLR